MSYGWIILDGYNVLHCIPRFKEFMAGSNIEEARHKLIEELSNYQGYSGTKITIVFDGHKTTKTKNSLLQYRNLEIIFSKKKKTADSVVERLVYLSKDKQDICVVTSDRTFQLLVFGMRVQTMSVENFFKTIEAEMSESWDKVKLRSFKKFSNKMWPE